jgi:16S rRNA (guanine1516-N2)-methyltransferase
MIAAEHEALTNLLACAHSRASELSIEANENGVDIRLSEAQLGFEHSFISGALPVRARQSTQALIKACSNKQRSIKKVLDLTAGWGIDSFTLAWHGRQVTLLEQNELLHAIVSYSLSRLAADSQGAAVAARISIELTNANSYLQSLGPNHEYDCIYLDPMFPRHKSSAKPAKEMQILQALTTNVEIESCFELALQTARRRVVVKRPLKATRLSSLKPDLVYREKTIRFDIYLTR